MVRVGINFQPDLARKQNQDFFIQSVMKKNSLQRRNDMSHGNIPFLKFVVIIAVASFAYLGNSAVGLAQEVPGSYQISFQANGVQVFSLPVCTPSACQELILKAHIEEEGSGLPAQGGMVIFQYCSYKGLPPNDITRADEAPSVACETGLATWDRLGADKVNDSGDAFQFFGAVVIPRTVGFRLRYIRQGSLIESGFSEPMDFTWVPAA
jgi:hypothetical protein